MRLCPTNRTNSDIGDKDEHLGTDHANPVPKRQSAHLGRSGHCEQIGQTAHNGANLAYGGTPGHLGRSRHSRHNAGNSGISGPTARSTQNPQIGHNG